MAAETIVAVFDTVPHAEKAIRELEAAGVPAHSIQHYEKGSEGTSQSEVTHAGSGHGFWSWLLGEEGGTDRTIYDRTVESGGTVVTVIVDGGQSDHVVSVLEANSPVDLEERASQYGLAGSTTAGATTAGTAGSGYAGAAGATATGLAQGTATTTAATLATGVDSVAGANRTGTEQVVQLAEETLEVGKRAVSGGTTRLRRYVVERPVEEQIRLRNERVSVERRPVTGTGGVAADAFTEKTIEVTETAEEAVVAKTARVKEELVLRKDVEERVETVRDTVRREEVEVDKPTGQPSVSGRASNPDR